MRLDIPTAIITAAIVAVLTFALTFAYTGGGERKLTADRV